LKFLKDSKSLDGKLIRKWDYPLEGIIGVSIQFENVSI
jgi:hypothetical protein